MVRLNSCFFYFVALTMIIPAKEDRIMASCSSCLGLVVLPRLLEKPLSGGQKGTTQHIYQVKERMIKK